jgi:tRNA(Ile)-lysidine synthase
MNINLEKFKGERIAIAVSGGVDSMALMHLVMSHPACGGSANEVGGGGDKKSYNLTPPQSASQTAPPQAGGHITILHVNHNLRLSSKVEAEYVKSESEKLGMHCEVFNLDKLSGNLESAARHARYNVMLDYCRKNNIGILMTAHQADDQIETFLMNLARGSGVYGLGGIRPSSLRYAETGPESGRDGILIVRPLLNAFRADLQKYCDDNGIKYFHDEMNDDEKFTRVRIRKNRHTLKNLLGISDERILLAINNLGRAREALERNSNYQIANSKFIFNAHELFSKPEELQLKFLSESLKNIGGNEFGPRMRDTIRLRDALRNDTIRTLSHCTIRRFRDKILIAPEGHSTSFRKKEDG